MGNMRLGFGAELLGSGLWNEAALTLAWATGEERDRVKALAAQAGQQTMNLRAAGAELAVLRAADGSLAGWAGVDVRTHPRHPEVFSLFVTPRFRGAGLGGLLEQFWWTYLDLRGCGTGYLRLEPDGNQAFIERGLASGYWRRASPDELGLKFAGACRKCGLFGNTCRRQAYFAVDVRKALAASTAARAPLNVAALPTKIDTGLPESPYVHQHVSADQRP